MRSRSQPEGGTPISSLIDVVFLLIIFFIVTAAQEKEIIDREIDLAQAKEVEAAEKIDPMTITLNLRKDGSLNIAKRSLTLPELRNILRGTYQDVGSPVPILIRVDGATPYRYVDDLQTVIKESGYYKIKLAARIVKDN